MPLFRRPEYRGHCVGLLGPWNTVYREALYTYTNLSEYTVASQDWALKYVPGS